MLQQSQLNQEQQSAVSQTMAEYLALTGTTKFNNEGDPDGEYTPIVAGNVRHSRGGKPWVTFDGGLRYYRLVETGDFDEDGFYIIANDDGLPLGTDCEGPLIILRQKIGKEICVIAFNTGWNYSHEIIWPEDIEKKEPIV